MLKNHGEITGRDEEGRFAPGNPYGGSRPGAGRPKKEISEWYQAKSSKARRVILEALAAARRDGSPDWEVRLKAARLIEDRAWGRSVQSIDTSGPDIRTEDVIKAIRYEQNKRGNNSKGRDGRPSKA